MRTLFRTCAQAIVIALLASVLTACDDLEPQTVALVVGNHLGAAQAVGADGKPGDLVAGVLDDLAGHPGTVSLIRLDGLPGLVSSLSLTIDADSSTTKEDSIADNRRRLVVAVGQTVALTGQTDPLAGLSLAADAVRGKPRPRITVIDNGLSTTGSLLMQSGIITQRIDVEDVATQLRDAGMLPDFTGITVDWIGLCSMQPPQQPCPPYAKDNLQALWEAIVGHPISFDSTPLPSQGNDHLPAVDPVPFPVDVVTPNPSTTPKPTPPRIPPLTEDRVRFQSNSNEFVDLDKARSVLRPIARQLQADAYPAAEITGCTANDPGSTLSGMKERGRGRARKVAAELKNLGATSRLTTGSPGWNCPGYLDDRDGNVQVEAKAAKNRKIIITAKPE